MVYTRMHVLRKRERASEKERDGPSTGREAKREPA